MKLMIKIKIIIIIFSLLSIINCGGDNNTPNEPIIAPPTTENPIVGGWAIVNSDGCISTFDFKKNMTFWWFSALKVNFGTYSITDNDDNTYTLAITVESDNAQIDCYGDSEDDTGDQWSEEVAINNYVLLFTESGLTFDKVVN